MIPGHQKFGCLLDRSGIKYTIDYLKATAEAMDETNDAASFFYFMEKRFPNNAISMYSNEMNSKVFKDPTFEWGWESEERKEERAQ